ncbi:MAG: four helix bundle protein [Desulfurivibrionaceae bacterium]
MGQQSGRNIKKDEFRNRAYNFSLEIIKFIDTLPKEKSCDIIGKQLLRSATSIGANVTEAKAASSKKKLHQLFPLCLKISQ